MIIITIITLEIFSFVSYYLARNLYEDIGIISTIYQNSINYYVVKPNFNGVVLAKGLLGCYLGISFIRIISVGLFPGLYINYKVIHGNWDISFIKKIIGKQYYYYFMKIYSYGSKTSLAWVYYWFLVLTYLCLASVFIDCFLIEYIDLITELYDKCNK